jgi:hypothetical protein
VLFLEQTSRPSFSKTNWYRNELELGSFGFVVSSRKVKKFAASGSWQLQLVLSLSSDAVQVELSRVLVGGSSLSLVSQEVGSFRLF